MPKKKRFLQSIQNAEERFWEVRALAGEKAGEVFIYGPIYNEKYFDDEVAPLALKDEIDELGDIDTLYVRINSPGGVAFAGIAIYNILKRVEAEVVVTVDGLAASAASLIAMSGDRVTMNTGSMIMIHNAWTFAIGEAKDLRKTADRLDQLQKSMVSIYKEKTGLSDEKIVELLNDETWMDAETAVELGFADRVDESAHVAAAMADDKVIVNGVEFEKEMFSKLPPEDFFENRERKRSSDDNPVRRAFNSLAVALGIKTDGGNMTATTPEGDVAKDEAKGSEPAMEDVKNTPVAESAAVPEARDGDAMSRDEFEAALAELRQRAEAAEAMARAERDKRVESEFVARVETYGSLPESASTLGPVMKRASEALSKEDFEIIENTLKAAGSALEQSELFKARGVDGDGDTSAKGQLDAAIAKMQEANPGMTYEAAYVEAFSSLPEDVQAKLM